MYLFILYSDPIAEYQVVSFDLQQNLQQRVVLSNYLTTVGHLNACDHYVITSSFTKLKHAAEDGSSCMYPILITGPKGCRKTIGLVLCY